MGRLKKIFRGPLAVIEPVEILHMLKFLTLTFGRNFLPVVTGQAEDIREYLPRSQAALEVAYNKVDKTEKKQKLINSFSFHGISPNMEKQCRKQFLR